MRKSLRSRLPLPSRCPDCGIAVHARFVRQGRADEIEWVHEATLADNLRKGGAHEARPDSTYQPQRFRVIVGVAVPREPAYAGALAA